MMVHSKICQSCILQRADYFQALAPYLETLGFIEVQDIPLVGGLQQMLDG
jgi:hypothetical protein